MPSGPFACADHRAIEVERHAREPKGHKPGHDPLLGLAAVLAPLLVLFRLKYGLVTSMLTALAEDP
ncbi:MAG: hypothetical protein M3461_22545 [Pseudomonadota bacterium]|nr:hypothetical protein [Pseudomonadota bacterium]